MGAYDVPGAAEKYKQAKGQTTTKFVRKTTPVSWRPTPKRVSTISRPDQGAAIGYVDYPRSPSAALWTPGGIGDVYQPGRAPAAPVYYDPGNVPATNEGVGASMWLPSSDEKGKAGGGVGKGKPVTYGGLNGKASVGVNGLSEKDWKLQGVSDMIEYIRARNEELELQFQNLYSQQGEEETPYYYGGGRGWGGGWGGYGGSGYRSSPYDFFFNLLNWRI